MLNPITWILAGFIAVFVMTAGLVALMLGGGSTVNIAAYTGSVGLDDVSAQYEQGVAFYNNAIANSRAGFDSIIDALYYDEDDLPNSDLVSMQLTRADGSVTNYSMGFASDGQRTLLRNAWNFPLSANEIIAIAYVWLQSEANTAQGTRGMIYSVTLTQDVFDTIIAHGAAYSENIISGVSCTGQNCVPADPPDPAACDAAHTFHGIGLRFYSRDAVMDALDFTDYDRLWVDATIWGYDDLFP
jgi:hypothetical protein